MLKSMLFFFRTSHSVSPLVTKRENRNKLLRRQIHSRHRDPNLKPGMEEEEEVVVVRRDNLTLKTRKSCALVE